MDEIQEKTCRCVLSPDDNEGIGYIITIAEYSRNNNLILCYKTVCKKCKTWYEDRDLILTEDQIDSYFGTKS